MPYTYTQPALDSTGEGCYIKASPVAWRQGFYLTAAQGCTTESGRQPRAYQRERFFIGRCPPREAGLSTRQGVLPPTAGGFFTPGKLDTMNQDSPHNPNRAEHWTAAAQPGPPEHRAAYAYLLAKLYEEHQDNAPDSTPEGEAWNAAFAFIRACLRLMRDCPELSPFTLAEVADAVAPVLPACSDFAARLRMLDYLRDTNETTTEGAAR